MRGLATLEEAGTLLAPGDDFVLGLPVAVVLAQRLRLPTVERDEFVEMVRIQIEKAMPYSDGRDDHRFRGHLPDGRGQRHFSCRRP